jgi:hypothetical protein
VNIPKILELLATARTKLGDGHHVTPLELLQLVYGKERPRQVQEFKARALMAREALRATMQAGYSHRAEFFHDVWPAALHALREQRRNTGAKRAAILLAGGEAQRDQTCVVVDTTEQGYTIQPGAQILTLHDGRRIRCDQTATVPRNLVRVLP